MTLTKDGISNKILLTVIGTVFVSLLTWGTWVTVSTLEIEDVIVCAAENKDRIDSKADALQRQINTRMDKQERKMDKQDDKLDKIMIILIDINKKER